MEEGGARSLLLVVTEDVAKIVVENMKENNYARYKIAGMVVIDKDMTGQWIDDVIVVAAVEDGSDRGKPSS